MDEIIKWCITGACVLLPAITIYLVVNVLSWKPKKKVADKNEIAQPQQYFWIFVGSTVLWSAMALLALFLPEEMDANDSSTFGCIFSFVFAFFSFLGAIWFYRWRIVLGKKEFTCYFFFRTRTYQYSEVHFKDFNNHYRIYCGKKYLCSVLDESDNGERLRGMIAKYSPIHNPKRNENH